MDGSVLSAPFDPETEKSGPQSREANTRTEVVHAPTAAAHEAQPSQSTIRAPILDIPEWHARKVEPPQKVTTVKRASFAWLLGGRAFTIGLFSTITLLLPNFPVGFATLGILTILVSGLLTGVAGVLAQSAYRAGKVLIGDGIMSILIGLVAAAFLAAENFVSFLQATAGWEIVTGALLIGAALELRSHVSKTVLLIFAGIFSMLSGLQALSIYIR